ncbi:MAG TPA: carboxypeptidase-like regulatory domain-containing protein [Terriglobales bacterium]|nr:carboxypeptidase-like regulatory domain-containing protein [Terriglobales bacterium]
MKGQPVLWRTFRQTSVPTPNYSTQCRKLLKLASLVLASFVLIALFSLGSFAQSASTGTIIGTITDQSGAVVPDASISVTDKATNTTMKTTSNSAGHYVLANVAPGSYDMKITKQGFQTAVVQGQAVDVGKQLTEDIRLTVGQVTQEVTVETTGTELQTMNSTVGNAVSGIALSSLPSLGRDVSTFVTLQPGVSPDGSVAGTVVDQSSFQLDGGQNTNDMDGSMSVYTPSFSGDPTGGVANQGNGVAAGPTGVLPTPADSVEEFKVNTANQTADFNSSSGAQVQMVTKHGTNTFHGSVYEYYFDNNLNANTWQNNHTNTPLPSYHYSRFGASLGGPLIPKEILGGKTYFFANYQGFRWPNSDTIERIVPTDSMRLGLIYDTGSKQYFNMNSTPVTFNGVTYQPAACPASANGLCDPRGLGINPLVSQLWSKFEPLPNEATCANGLCDATGGVGNVGGFRANIGIPQNDNFGVLRLDHDFGQKFHFNATYHYYRLTRATEDQVDIGGFFPGDKLGVPTSLSNRPQVPWLYTAGLTTNISSTITNDFHYSFLRNWWQWGTAQDVPQFSQLGGALEPFGESATSVLIPYNVNTQQTRQRFWDGLDHFFRDDVTMLKGNHLFTFGGAYQHNFDFHSRTDNGGGINYQPVYQLGTTSGSGIDMTGFIPDGYTGSAKNFGRDYAAMLGIVSVSQQAFTRSGANLALNPPNTPAFDKSTIPYYNVYFSDSWHMKPNFTLTYGLGWTLEMPPVEQDGKQVEFVDQADQPIDVLSYIASKQRAALQGQVYNPPVGFALIGNTANSPKYPYDPFYGEFSPRIAAAWNPHFDSDTWLSKIFGEDKSVLRGGYGRIFGRLNGVDLVLVPLLGTGLIQPVQCVGALTGGGCGGSTGATPANAFRIGTDGNTAPLGAALPTLPQPDFPGINDIAAGAGESLDPHFRPNVVDSFDLTLQRQLSSKVTMELGYIGRRITHEYLPINVNAVPYMMTMGGQQFQQAYAAVEKAMGCTISTNACGAAGAAAAAAAVAPQPFFESALAGTGYCTGFSSCTAAVVTNQFSNFQGQAVWDLWSALDNGGTAPGFNFGHTMLNTAGQLSSGVGVNASVGYGNYNAGFVTLRMADWKGLTMQSNFTWSKAMGTGALVQATSEYTADDAFDIGKMYGLQAYDRKYVYNMFVVYQPPFFRNQPGIVGHLLGGWVIAPIFAAGSGLPLEVNTVNGDSEGFGEGDNLNFFSNENSVLTSAYNAGTSRHDGVTGSGGVGTSGFGSNMFANPEAVFNQFRQPILGIDSNVGGFGILRGLPYWNVDLSLRKEFRITERVGTEAQVIFTNVLNHDQFGDPQGSHLDTSNPARFGTLPGEVGTPRQMEFGLRVTF